MQQVYDVLIVGGGQVGASLARAIAGSGLRIAVIEALPAQAPAQPSYDDRVIALGWGSRRILEGIGLWADLAASAEPIRRVHISDRGHFGFARIGCREAGVEALGYVLPARDLGRVLHQGLDGLVDLYCPARLLDFRLGAERVDAALELDRQTLSLQARLLVAADGGDSPVRERLGFQAREWSYGQTAVIANVTPVRPHQGVAYERFTDSGPLALLPMTEGRCSLVWTQRDDAVEALLALDDQAFLRALQARFGQRLGCFARVGRRASYPLRQLLVGDPVRPRLALIGNAAHTLHPVAGQGFNLGLRDVAVLAELLVEQASAGADPGAMPLLARYREWRRPDQNALALVTDGLVRLFSNPLLPLRLGRNLGLLGFDLLPPLKQAAARRFMGLGGRLPRLGRGLPLVAPGGGRRDV
jgi:2-octaprenyl-6-methoxyphenol hydroxylase